MMTLVKERSSPLSSWYTMLTKALLAAGFPTGAPWIRSFRVFTRRLLVFSANTKLMASIRLDFPKTTMKTLVCKIFTAIIRKYSIYVNKALGTMYNPIVS